MSAIDLALVKDIMLVTGVTVGIGYNMHSWWNKRSEGRPRIKVSQSPGFRVGPLGPSDTLCLLEAQNHGVCAVTLSGFGFQLPDSRYLVFQDELGRVPFPVKLEPGSSAQVGMFYRNLVGSLASEGYAPGTRLQPYVRDQLGRTFKGKRFAVT